MSTSRFRLPALAIWAVIAVFARADAGSIEFLEKPPIDCAQKDIVQATAGKISDVQLEVEAKSLIESGAKIRAQVELRRIEIPDDEVSDAAAAAWLSLHAGKWPTGEALTTERLVAAMQTIARVPIESEPDKAEVFVDGTQMFNQTNNHFYMEPGTHNLLLTKPGYRKEQDIKVSSGQNNAIRVKLDKAP